MAVLMQEPRIQIGGGSHNLEVIVVLVDLQQSIWCIYMGMIDGAWLADRNACIT